jgi:hypothetical protein
MSGARGGGASQERPPTTRQADAIEAFADALYELLEERSQSLGIIDVALEVDGWFVDAELVFAKGPDIGLSLHAGAGECRFCELVGSEAERWLEESGVVEGIDVLDDSDVDGDRERALRVLNGMLDARRPLLTRD